MARKSHGWEKRRRSTARRFLPWPALESGGTSLYWQWQPLLWPFCLCLSHLPPPNLHACAHYFPFPQHRHARDEADGEELGTPSKARAHCSLLAQGTVAAAPPPEPWRAQGSAAAVLGSLGVLGTLLVIAVLSGDPAVLPWAYAALGAGTLHATLALLLPRTLTLGEGALITQVRLLKGRAGRGPRI